MLVSSKQLLEERTGSSQDHLVGFHLLTILTGQSHISKVIVLSQVSKNTFDQSQQSQARGRHSVPQRWEKASPPNCLSCNCPVMYFTRTTSIMHGFAPIDLKKGGSHIKKIKRKHYKMCSRLSRINDETSLTPSALKKPTINALKQMCTSCRDGRRRRRHPPQLATHFI